MLMFPRLLQSRKQQQQHGRQKHRPVAVRSPYSTPSATATIAIDSPTTPPTQQPSTQQAVAAPVDISTQEPIAPVSATVEVVDEQQSQGNILPSPVPNPDSLPAYPEPAEPVTIAVSSEQDDDAQDINPRLPQRWLL
ncbi:MAG: hypothetical protein R3C44_06190 [Chloroflexota bacterium]